MTGIVNKPIAALFMLCLAAAFVAVPAQASSRTSSTAPAVPKPKCTTGPITYNDQTGLVAVKSGQCFIPAYKGHKRQRLHSVWAYSWIGYDQNNSPITPGGRGTGKKMSFKLNPALFDHVKAIFTIFSPKTKTHPRVSAVSTKVIQMGGGAGAGNGKLGDGPGNTPPAVVNGVNPLCPFTDPYVENVLKNAQCGTYTQGSGAFVTPPTVAPDGTVHAGKWLTPTGGCSAPPNTAKGPYSWFGYNVFLVTGYLCGDGSLVGQMGVATITLVNPDGSSCTLHPDGFLVATFRLNPAWGGMLKVTFTETTVTRSTGYLWPPEYETAQLKLAGKQNGCASPDWKIASVQ